MRATLRADFARNPDPLTRAVLLVFRIGQWAHRQGRMMRLLVGVPYKIANLLLLRLGVGCDLPARLTCGPGLRLHHCGRGVAVHPRATLGANVTLFQQVAIGQRDNTGEPVIGNGVLIGVGACVLGPVHLGDGARVAPNATVLDDVPAGGSAVGPRATIREPAPVSQG